MLSDLGGGPLLTLHADPAPHSPARFVSAVVLPGRGMLLAKLSAVVPDLGEVEILTSPPLEILPEHFSGPADLHGNASFSLGAAVLAPFANRIRGAPVGDGAIRANPGMILPANWSGKAPESEAYAMHGLILQAPFDLVEQTRGGVVGRFDAGDFGGAWPSRTLLTIGYDLRPDRLVLTVGARNVGKEPTPMGIGWHPYFNILSGRRDQVRLTLPAASRLEVGDYDAVLPTGAVLPVRGPYDFRDGAALGDLYLDDCFVHLARPSGEVEIEIADAACRLRITATSPHVQAVQVFAPLDQPFIAVEPQFNRPDPFSTLWDDEGGMVWLQPGQATTYEVAVGIGERATDQGR